MYRVLAALLLLLADPAVASTAEEIVAHGMIATFGDVAIEVIFFADGSLTAANGRIVGSWRIDRDKLCTRSNVHSEEKCDPYPRGKKSGDRFEVTSRRDR